MKIDQIINANDLNYEELIKNPRKYFIVRIDENTNAVMHSYCVEGMTINDIQQALAESDEALIRIEV